MKRLFYRLGQAWVSRVTNDAAADVPVIGGDVSAAPFEPEDDEGVCMDCGGPLGKDERKGFPHHACCLCGGFCTDPVNHLSLPGEIACAFQPSNPAYAPCTRAAGHSGPCAHPLAAPQTEARTAP